MKPRTITLFRHGQSAYLMGNSSCSVENAFDLRAKPEYPEEPIPQQILRACEEVRRSILRLIPTMDPKHAVVLFSSPVARTIHTARIISSELCLNGFSVSDIILQDNIGEVRNFSWALFEPLVYGGVINYEGHSFLVDETLTNPAELNYSEFFEQDCLHKIAKSVKADWPQEYVAQIESFEKFPSVTERSLEFIQAGAPEWVTGGHTVFVAHDANAMYLADKFTEGRQKGLVPGTSLSLEHNSEGKLVVTRVGDITDGDSTTAFFQKFLGR